MCVCVCVCVFACVCVCSSGAAKSDKANPTTFEQKLRAEILDDELNSAELDLDDLTSMMAEIEDTSEMDGMMRDDISCFVNSYFAIILVLMCRGNVRENHARSQGHECVNSFCSKYSHIYSAHIYTQACVHKNDKILICATPIYRQVTDHLAPCFLRFFSTTDYSRGQNTKGRINN